jgi:adenosine deaminase/aminodeoxyfutalosine deaminase
MNREEVLAALIALPKAELHLHLEGSIRPRTVVELARRHGDKISIAEAEARYQYSDFRGFLDAFKWVTSYLREPEDYALVTERMIEELAAENVVHAEVIVALGVMLWRKQNPEANFRAIRAAAERGKNSGVRIALAPDATRQFGAEAALRTAEWAVHLRGLGVVSFGIGGDELSVPAQEFRPAFDYAAEHGLNCTAHAGEIGGAKEVRDAIKYLRAKRIGHGIAAVHDLALMRELKEKDIALEICPWSNVRTGALVMQFGSSSRIEQHPLKRFVDAGVPVTISTDDPAMFHTDLRSEYDAALRMGLNQTQLGDIVEGAMAHAFVAESEKKAYFAASKRRRVELGLA